MTWDALQREMLAALGHTVYVRADAPAVQPAHPGLRDDTADAGSSGPGATGTLLGALLRAANLQEVQLPALQPHLPPLPSLAGNTAAKRALWPALRALRSSTGAQ